MLCTIVPWADAIYIFERTGKVKLIGIADHGADGADGQAAFGQQLCRPCHAVVQQKPLRTFAHGIPEHLAEIAAVQSAEGGDTVKDILKFFGSEEGQRIQGESGAAIPAYQGLEDTWAGCFAEYPINIQCFIEMFEYSIQSVNNASRPEWKSKVSDELLKIYAGTEDIETGLQKMQDIVDQASAG